MGNKNEPDLAARMASLLAQREKRFLDLMEQTSDWIWEVDTEGVLTYASPKVEDLLGYAPNEVVGRSIFELLPQEEATRVGVPYEKLIRQRQPFRGILNIYQHKDGHRVMLESNGAPIFNEAGECSGYRGIERDITERYQYEQALEQERDFSNAVIENAGALVVVLDKEGRIIRFNNTCEEVTLYTSAEVLGRHIWDFLLLPEEIEDVKDIFLTLEITTLPSKHTNYWVAKDKSLHLINWSNVEVRDKEGRCDYLLSIGVDVTEQTILQKTLTERSELLERIFENAHALKAYMDTDFNFIRVNHAYASTDNKTEQYFVGRNHFDLYPNEENERIFNKVVESGEIYFSYARPFEYKYAPEKGITHWDWSLSPIKDEQGNVVAVLLVLADVTERIRAQEMLLRNEDAMNTAQSIAHFGSWDWDILTGDLVWSDEIYRIFGLAPRSIPATYDVFLNTIHPDDRDKVLNAVNAAVKDADVQYNVEHRIVRPDGEVREVHEQGEVYRDTNGRPIRMIGTVHDITERKHAEHEMLIKDLAMQNSISAIAMADLQAQLSYVNQAFLDIWGYQLADEVLGRSALEFWKNPQQVEVMIEELISAGRWVGEMEAIRKDGIEMLVRVSANITYDKQGKPLNMMASFVDVTEQRATELALRLNQELLAKAQEIAHVGSWDWDIKAGVLKWSDETYRIFDRDTDSFKETYEHFLDCVHQDDRAFVDDAVRKGLSEPDKPYRIEHRIMQPSGKVRSVLEQGVIYCDENGEPVQMVGAVLDITERKQFVDELKNYRDHLEELVRQRTNEVEWQSAKNAMIINSAMDGFYVIDAKGQLRDCNNAFQTMLGYSKDEALNLKVPDFEAQESQEEVKRHLENIIKNGSDRFDTKHKCKDGTIIDVEVNVTVGMLEDEKLFFTYAHNISDRKQVEAEIIKARDEAERANKLKSEFLGRVSHELRTPMNAILGFGQLMEEETLNENQKNFMHEIMLASRHLMGLIDEVLDLAKVETGKIDLVITPIPVLDLVQESIALISHQADEANITIKNMIEDHSLLVRGDRMRFKEVIVNLLSNAVKYNRPNGMITVTVRRLPERNVLRLQVTDTGKGINLEQQNMIFEPFNRLGAEYTKIEGTGIGLTICKQLIELMGGKIGLESQLQQGSKFWVELPMDSESDVVSSNSEKEIRQTVLDESKTILYIEDNPANLRLMESIIKQQPCWTLYTAQNAEQGILIARQEQPDLVILDLQLPGIDGYEALAALKSYPETQHIKCVALSAAAMPRDIEKGLLAGFKRYLTKPIDLTDLWDMLRVELRND